MFEATCEQYQIQDRSRIGFMINCLSEISLDFYVDHIQGR